MGHCMRARARLLLALLVLLTLPPWGAPPAHAATITVASLADSGPGSLRQAILDANGSPADDTIRFAPAIDGGTILLAAPLPAITSGGALSIIGSGATRTLISGGGVALVLTVAPGATVRISGVTIMDGANTGGAGGGISNSGSLTVTASAIRGNRATSGGGIYNNSGASLTLVNSAVSANTAGVGGGIFGFSSAILLANSTLSANSGATGGGVFANSATLTIQNSIIANSISGGGDCVTASSVRVVQSSLIEDSTCGVSAGVGGNLAGDPLLNADLTLGLGSAAVDAGTDSLIPAGITTDLAGGARIFGARVDMGAYESGQAPPPRRPLTAMLPLVALPPAPAQPDLVVEQILLMPDQTRFTAGEPVEIRVRVTNIGDAAASGFWVDLYLSPSAPPGVVNQRWNELCALSPCYGMAWSVLSLAPGASVVLSSTAVDAGQSIWPGGFAAGTTVIYAFADSYNAGVATGANVERDEGNNVAVLTGLSVEGGGAALPAGAPPPLPPRALP